MQHFIELCYGIFSVGLLTSQNSTGLNNPPPVEYIKKVKTSETIFQKNCKYLTFNFRRLFKVNNISVNGLTKYFRTYLLFLLILAKFEALS